MSFGNIGSGNKVVATAGTAVQLSATSVPVKRVIITPFSANTGVVAVGSSNVVASATLGSQVGMVMIKGANPLELLQENLSKIWVDASVSGEGVSFTYEY